MFWFGVYYFTSYKLFKNQILFNSSAVRCLRCSFVLRRVLGRAVEQSRQFAIRSGLNQNESRSTGRARRAQHQTPVVAKAHLPTEHHRPTAATSVRQGGDQHDRSLGAHHQTGQSAVQITQGYQDNDRLFAIRRFVGLFTGSNQPTNQSFLR